MHGFCHFVGCFYVWFCRQASQHPPLIGFLAAGFILNALGYTNNDALQIIADPGITILRSRSALNCLKDLIARPVWVSGLSHTAIWVAVVSHSSLFWEMC